MLLITNANAQFMPIEMMFMHSLIWLARNENVLKQSVKHFHQSALNVCTIYVFEKENMNKVQMIVQLACTKKYGICS